MNGAQRTDVCTEHGVVGLGSSQLAERPGQFLRNAGYL